MCEEVRAQTAREPTELEKEEGRGRRRRRRKERERRVRRERSGRRNFCRSLSSSNKVRPLVFDLSLSISVSLSRASTHHIQRGDSSVQQVVVRKRGEIT